MKEHNPDNPILHEAVNGTPVATPPVKTPNKKRDLDTMINGFQGDSSATRSYPIPKPTLERDFQMSVQLNPKISVGPGIWGQRNWIGYISGHWNGRWGKGTVVVSLSSICVCFLVHDRLRWQDLTRTTTVTTARWSRLPARRPRPLHPSGRELSSPNSRSPSGFYLCQNWWMACRPTRDARETWRPGPRWRGRSEILLFPSLCAHGDWRSSVFAPQYWHVGRQWYPQGYWRYVSPPSSFFFIFSKFSWHLTTGYKSWHILSSAPFIAVIYDAYRIV